MDILVVGRLARIADRAPISRLPGEFSSFADTCYHSAVNSATPADGDVVMSEEHGLPGAPEAVEGALLIGVPASALQLALKG